MTLARVVPADSTSATSSRRSTCKPDLRMTLARVVPADSTSATSS